MTASAAQTDRWGIRGGAAHGVFPRSKAAAVIAVALALGIFVVDTLTPYGFAVAVLYVIVVLLAGSFLRRQGVLLVAAGCIALAIVSFVVAHGSFDNQEALLRCVMSLAAIAITTALVLRNERVTAVLSEQASLLDLTHDTVHVRDMADVITYWNKGAEKLYGWPREEALGRVMHNLTQTVFPAPLPDIMAELLRTGHWEGELVHTKKDGSQVDMASRWLLQRDQHGRPVAILETNTDVTERKRAEEALQRAHAELAHATRMTTLGELAASIAHEVNQPLAGIVTHGEACLRWLGRAEPQLDEVRSAVERMIGDGRRASDVVRRLRELAKKGNLQAVPQSVNDIVEEAVQLVQREISSHRVMLRLDLSAGLPPVLADRVQLQQVIINLILNAIQAMATVTDRPRELLIRSGRTEDGQVQLTVRDRGSGIDPLVADRLFQPFFTTKPDGMGMGLSISRSIVEAHGGRIWALGNAGPGATVHLALPPHPATPS